MWLWLSMRAWWSRCGRSSRRCRINQALYVPTSRPRSGVQTHPNRPDLHRRDRRVLHSPRLCTSVDQPGGQRIRGSNPLSSTLAVASAAEDSPRSGLAVIVTPSSTVRTIVSARTWAGENVGCDTGPPGVADHGVGNLHHQPPGPVSAHRHGPSPPGRHGPTCTPFPEEPIKHSSGTSVGGRIRCSTNDQIMLFYDPIIREVSCASAPVPMPSGCPMTRFSPPGDGPALRVEPKVLSKCTHCILGGNYPGPTISTFGCHSSASGPMP
jgi:hypothetical protein